MEALNSKWINKVAHKEAHIQKGKVSKKINQLIANDNNRKAMEHIMIQSTYHKLMYQHIEEITKEFVTGVDKKKDSTIEL